MPVSHPPQFGSGSGSQKCVEEVDDPEAYVLFLLREKASVVTIPIADYSALGKAVEGIIAA